MTTAIVMYSTRFCPYCMAARRLLRAKDVAYEEIPVDGNPELRRHMTELAGQRTVPQIWVGDTHVGGYTDLAALDSSGELDRLLSAAN